MYIKTINLIFLIFFIFSCSLNMKNNLDRNYNLKIETPTNKYNHLLSFELQKFNKFNKNYEDTFFLEANITFSSQETLTLNGLSPLYKMIGTIDYKLSKNNNNIKKGKISSTINYGSVTSYYGKEENQKFVKQRIVRNLALKLLNKIKLIINKIEN